MHKPTARSPRPSRGIMVLHRTREPCRYRGGLLETEANFQRARRGAHVRQARVLRLLSTESERGVSLACAHTRRQASRAQGQGRRVEALTCTERERPLLLCGDLLGCEGELEPAQRRKRTRQARVRRFIPTESASGGRSLAHMRKPAAREAKAGAWHHVLAPNERALPLARRPSRAGEPVSSSAARRAHDASARAARPPERESARGSAFFLRTCARKLLVGGRGWHVGPRLCTEGEGRLAGVVSFQRARTDSNQRGAARTRRKRACYASNRERERAR